MDQTLTKIEIDLLKGMYHNKESIPLINEIITYKQIQEGNREIKAIFFSITRLWYNEKDVNEITIENEAVKYSSNSDKLLELIEEIVEEEPLNDWKDNVETLVDAYVRRTVKAGCQTVIRMVDSPRVSRSTISEKLQLLSEISEEQIEEEDMDDMLERDDVVPIFHPVISRIMGSVVKGDIFTIGGEAGMGKTTLAIELANGWVENGIKTLFESIEMTYDQVWKKLAARRLGINSNYVTKRWKQFKQGKIGEINTEEMYKKFMEEINYLKDEVNNKTLKIRSYSNNVTDIKLDARKFKPDVLIIDWVQMMEMPSLSGGTGFTNMAQGIPEILKSIKALSKRLNFATILVAQIECNGRRPTISDFTDSKAFKKYSSDIMAVYYHYQTEALSSIKDKIELIQLKDRFGSSGNRGVCKFERETGRIGELVSPAEKADYLNKTKAKRKRF